MRKSLVHAGIFSLLIIPSVSSAQVQQSWVRKYVGLGADNAAAITTDNSGNIWICGNNNWGYSTADMYLVRYNSAGTQTAGLLYNSPYNNADEARAIATDNSGNVYVAGKISQNSSTSDIVVIKYSSYPIQQWATIFNTPQNYIDDVTAMVVDAAGNVYLTGSVVKDAAFEYDYLTVKINSAGVVQWSVTYNGTANGVDIANAITVDAAGNVFVTGLSSGQIYKRYFTINTGYDITTIKYSPDGVQQWVQRYNYSSSNDEGKSIALDPSGNVYVTGSVYSSGTKTDAATIKYANDGTFQWLQIYNGAASSDDAAAKLVVDGAGNAIITGYTYNSEGRADVLTTKYNSAGTILWTAIYDAGSGTQDVGKTLKLDQYGNAYVAAETSVPGVTNSDFLTIKYTTSGVRSWVARYNGPENGVDNPTSIAVVNPTGSSAANATIYVYGGSANDVITIKYTQPTIIWAEANKETQVAVEAGNALFSVYHAPNPARSFTNIFYKIPSDGRVSIDVFDAVGRKVSTLVDKFQKAGNYSSRFNTKNLTSGEYFYQVRVNSNGKQIIETRKLVLQR